MTIPFKQIPANLRTPLFYAEVDNSRANSGQINQRAVILAQKTASGNGVANVPILSQGIDHAAIVGGLGSMLHLMVAAYRKSDTFGELWIVPLDDNGAAVVAAGSFKFTHVATANGTLNLYLGGQRLQLPIASTQTMAQMATALAAAINAATNLPVTAAVDGSDTTMVNISAKNLGASGNDIQISLNYLGTAGGEETPAGITSTIVAMANGATNPVLTTALANLSDQPFDFVINPYVDTTSLDAIKSFLNDTTGRWSWQSQVYGHAFTAYRGTVGALTTFGTGRNDQHNSVLGFYASPTPSWVVAADFAATCANSLRVDPGVPLQTLALSSMLAPPLASRFALTDRNTLLFDGISTFTVADDGTVALENVITTYQKNAFAQADDSYLEIETMFLLMLVLRRLRGVVTSKYARVKLAADGTRFAAGSGIVTPSIIKADIIAEYGLLEEQGFVQKTSDFAKALIVEQNATNPNRVDVLWPGTLINQLRIFALLAQFRL